MNAVWIFLIVTALVAAAAGLYTAAYKAGRQAAKADTLEKGHDDAMEAAAVRDRLRHDDRFARRVRARFTR